LTVGATFCISLVLAFVMGLAIQRGNACMVVAFDDLIYRRSAVRLSTIVSTWLMVPGGLALLYLMAGFTPAVKMFPVTAWSVVGGMLLGIGAVVAGACTGGVVARIGSGEYVFILTIVGLAAGCVLAQAFGPAATINAATAPTTVVPHYPVFAIVGLVVVLAVNVRWLLKGRHEAWRDFLHNAWDPRIATIVIATVTLALVQIYGRHWGYAELLGDASRGASTHPGRVSAVCRAADRGNRWRSHLHARQAHRPAQGTGHPMLHRRTDHGDRFQPGPRIVQRADFFRPAPPYAVRVGRDGGRVCHDPARIVLPAIQVR
jgi:uncharacterized membrane protein YedE/YeeE